MELLSLLSNGHIAAWGDYDGADEDDDEWIVGIALTGLGGKPRKLRKGERPSCWREIATVRGRKLAEALASHLNSLRQSNT